MRELYTKMCSAEERTFLVIKHGQVTPLHMHKATTFRNLLKIIQDEDLKAFLASDMHLKKETEDDVIQWFVEVNADKLFQYIFSIYELVENQLDVVVP
jgi:DeoR/GlpR family transcriptional regulator of sugar metabolism